MSSTNERYYRRESTRNRNHIAKAKRVSKYDIIELELDDPRRPVILNKKSIASAIHELKYPKDVRLTPLTQAQIEQDLYELGLI